MIKSEQDYHNWYKNCIRYQTAFVPYNERYKAWVAVGGGIIKDKNEAMAYAKRLYVFMRLNRE